LVRLISVSGAGVLLVDLLGLISGVIRGSFSTRAYRRSVRVSGGFGGVSSGRDPTE
jgi:hypothetical protein